MLAAAANVSRSTVVSFEKGQRSPNGNNLAAIQRALEASGVIFVQENGDGPGVRLKKTGASGRAHALEQAEAAADRMLADVDAQDDEKARRKQVVTRVAKGMRKAT